MEEDTEYLKLPVEDRCQHKLWKARLNGYEAATKLFQETCDEKSPEWGKYLGLVKKFVADSNAVAQEKGLDAVLAYVENAGCAGKTCGEVMAGIIAKCLGAPKVKTKEKAMEIVMMYIEIERVEVVQDELIKGLSAKTPKVVVACVQCLRTALRDFGSKVVTLKPIVKQLPVLLEDRDKGVRDEAKALTVEIYRWVGPAIKPQLTSLKPVQLTELEAEFEKVTSEKVAPCRFFRSQQALRAKAAAEQPNGDEGAEDEEDEVDAVAPVDPYEFMQPVDILSMLPKDFYENCEAKKWQERKEAMDTLVPLAANPKLESGDYGDLVRALRKIISKDTNVMVVALAGKCLAGLAAGLQKRFQQFVGQCVSIVLEKFKEKKQNVVQAMREAIDAIYSCTNLEAIQEDVLEALDNKNPSVRSETAAFVARAFSKCDPAAVNRKLLKAFCESLLKILKNDPDPTVRDNSAEALGTAMKAVGEKMMTPFLSDLEAIKMAKVKECCEKAVVTGPKRKKPAGAAATAPASAAASRKPEVKAPAKAASSAPAAGRKSRPASNNKLPPGKSAGKKKPAKAAPQEVMEKELSADEVEEKAADLLPPEAIAGLTDANWKTRLGAVEQFMNVVRTLSRLEIPTQVFVRTLLKKPGLKENNFQVLKMKLEVVTYLASNSNLTRLSARYLIDDLAEKIGDAKNGTAAAEALTAISEATKLDFVSTQVLDFVFAQKNPKNQSEAMNWLANAIKDFGFLIQVKPIIDNVKKALAATNPAVRTSAVTLLGVMYMYMGANLRMLFENEKAALLQQIDAEFEKIQGLAPPPATRGLAVEAPGNEDDDGEGGSAENAAAAIVDRIPRTDISGQITSGLLAEMGDKSWKLRLESLQKLAAIINEVKFITPNLGDLPTAFKARMLDSNKNLATQALNICQAIGTGIGPNCNKYVRLLAPAMMTSLGDSKNTVRTAATSCLNAWVEQCGITPFVEGDLLSESLKLENPTLRAELLGWLTEQLPQVKSTGVPTADLALCIPFLCAALEDRNGDVRKKAQDAVLPFMIHLGYEQMARTASKLKPNSKTQVMAAFDKAKPNLPAKLPPNNTKAVRGGGGGGGSKVNAQSSPSPTSGANNSFEDCGSDASAGGRQTSGAANKGKMNRATSKTRLNSKPNATGKKKDEDVDTSPPIVANSLKEHRISDEQKLKVLRWNFTTPRDEFYELLKEQMTAAGFNRNFLFQLFHNDFKFHLKAIDTYLECLDSCPEATVANLDLALKWLALRFFDTNPSVLLKGLEYLQGLFQLLHAGHYHLHDYEANSFIPYLILKVGDSKDAVRQSVRTIFKLIYRVYPAHKMFLLLMEGLKSKNARQRTECLEELGILIEMYGMPVCQPNPPTALKEVARQISDRDNSVRNAALNCIVNAFFLDGEKVYKYVGAISDKDMGLLEERIKRASKNRPPSGPPASMVINQLPKAQSPELSKSRPVANSRPPVAQPQEEQVTVVKRYSAGRPPVSRPVSGVFSLDLENVESRWGPEIPQLVQHDIDDILNEPIKLPESKMRPPTPASKILNNSHDAASAMDSVISHIASNDMKISIQALVQIDEFLKDEGRAEAMATRVDQLLVSASIQYRMTYTKHMGDEMTNRADIVPLYRCLTMTLLSLFHHPCLAKRASKDVLKDLVYNLVTILLDTRLTDLREGPDVIRTINVLVVKVIGKSDHTCMMTALIKLLHDCIANDNSSAKFTELIMKCLWKMIRLLQDIIHEMNLDRILLDLHQFLKAFPSSHWKGRTNDTPLRTIKTVLHTLAKLKGNKIMSHLTLIDNLQDSEIEPYLQKVLKGGVRHRTNAAVIGDQNQATDQTGEHLSSRGKESRHSPRRLSKTTQEILADIFKKIGSKNKTKEGLADLYAFKKRYPEADIEPFLCKSSQFFQSYIERGLVNIELEHEGKGSVGGQLQKHNLLSNSTGSIPSATAGSMGGGGTYGQLASATTDTNPSIYLERLKELKAKCGFTEYVTESGIVMMSKTSRATLSKAVSVSGNLESQTRCEEESAAQHESHTTTVYTVTHSNSSEGLSSLSAMGGPVEALRRRLERIKCATNP